MQFSRKSKIFFAIILVVIILSLFDTFIIPFFINNEEVDSDNTLCEINSSESLLNEFIQWYAYDIYQLHQWKPVSPISPVTELEANMPGENGSPVHIDNQVKRMRKKFKLHQFNLLASDMISLNRSLPDVQLSKCKCVKYPKYLPSTSVVIAFYNEAWSTLFRTVWSVINRSPKSLLKEIILVDDFSDKEYLGKKLENYIKKLPVLVRLLRTDYRHGLVQARFHGARFANGQVITFLNSYCECADGWLEPLLARIVMDRKTVASPIIDTISAETFEYFVGNDFLWGGFTWQLIFEWFHIPNRELNRRIADRTIPIRTPAMSGGIFAIDREYFHELGGFDEGINMFGSENLEMSFKIWLCGGTLEIVPCSHVGCVFRRVSQSLKVSDDIKRQILYNIVRLVEVWLDEWREFFYLMNPETLGINPGDLSRSKKLQKGLKCKNFRWYLENIYPESQLPFDYYYLGWIKNVQTEECLEHSLGLRLAPCCCLSQIFVYTKLKQIVANYTCLSADKIDGPAILLMCHQLDGNQEWFYNEKDKMIIHMNTGGCLQPKKRDVHHLKLAHCEQNNLSQQWLMDKQLKWQVNHNNTNRYVKSEL